MRSSLDPSGTGLSRLLFMLVVLLSFSSWQPSGLAQQADEALPTIKLDGMDLPFVRHEAFETGRDNWTTTDDSAWSIRSDPQKPGHTFGLNRRQSNYQPKHRSPLNIALWKHDKVNDFVLTFDVRSTKDTGNHRDCCIFFGYQNPTQFYYAHLGAKPDPASGQVMIVNNAPRTPISENKNPVGWDDNWHKVKVTRNSGTGEIKVYFDDMQKPLMTAADKTFGLGQIGIGSFDDMNDFDNITLYGR
ncbi:MAG: hypothetical protein MK108_11400 [Mariniblastus sp.]|nr:hypothetical protein [Mariniblastus sp.]